MIAEIFPSSVCVLRQGGIKYCLKVKGSGGHIRGRGHGIIMGEMSDLRVGGKKVGMIVKVKPSRGRLVPSDMLISRRPCCSRPLSAERFDNGNLALLRRVSCVEYQRFFFSVRALSLLSLPSDAAERVSACPCCFAFTFSVFSLSTSPSLAVFTSALDDTPTLAAQA